LSGLPGHPICSVSLTNFRLVGGGGGTAEDAALRSVPEFTLETLGNWWPEYYGLEGALPSCGIFARHVHDLTLNGVTIETAVEDARPRIICEDVVGLRIFNSATQACPEAESSVRFINVQNAVLQGITSYPRAKGFLAVEGRQTKSIIFIHPELLGDSVVEIDPSVPPNSVC
jgi:hypothetical protein